MKKSLPLQVKSRMSLSNQTCGFSLFIGPIFKVIVFVGQFLDHLQRVCLNVLLVHLLLGRAALRGFDFDFLRKAARLGDTLM